MLALNRVAGPSLFFDLPGAILREAAWAHFGDIASSCTREILIEFFLSRVEDEL